MVSRSELLAALDFQDGYSGIPEKTTSHVLLMIVRTITMGELAIMKRDHSDTIIAWYKENRT